MTSDSTGVTDEALPATIVPRWEWRTFGADDSAFAERSAGERAGERRALPALGAERRLGQGPRAS